MLSFNQHLQIFHLDGPILAHTCCMVGPIFAHSLPHGQKLELLVR